MNTETKPDYEIANDQARALYDTLGLTVQISNPRGSVDDKDWPNIEYDFSFSKNGKSLTTQYRLGVGHVDWEKPKAGTVGFFTGGSMLQLTPTEESVLYTIQRTPSAQLKDKVLWATVAAKLAKAQKIVPKPHEVLASICRDGLDAHGQPFEEWADNYGYDKDSRAAEKIYRTCCDFYFPTEKLIGAENIRKLAELANQF